MLSENIRRRKPHRTVGPLAGSFLAPDLDVVHDVETPAGSVFLPVVAWQRAERTG